MESFPEELLVQIFHYFDSPQMFLDVLPLVCKRFREICQIKYAWKNVRAVVPLLGNDEKSFKLGCRILSFAPAVHSLEVSHATQVYHPTQDKFDAIILKLLKETSLTVFHSVTFTPWLPVIFHNAYLDFVERQASFLRKVTLIVDEFSKSRNGHSALQVFSLLSKLREAKLEVFFFYTSPHTPLKHVTLKKLGIQMYCSTLNDHVLDLFSPSLQELEIRTCVNKAYPDLKRAVQRCLNLNRAIVNLPMVSVLSKHKKLKFLDVHLPSSTTEEDLFSAFRKCLRINTVEKINLIVPRSFLSFRVDADESFRCSLHNKLMDIGTRIVGDKMCNQKVTIDISFNSSYY